MFELMLNSNRKKASYDVIVNKTSVNEGENITFTITTTNINNSTTLYYTISGTVSASDFTDNVSSGSFVVNDNTATITKTLKSDSVVEGTETAIFNLRTGSTSGTIVAQSSTINISDSTSAVAWENWVASRGYSAFATHSTGYRVVKITSWTGNMWGTPYLNNYTSDSHGSRIVQHALPTQAIVNDYLANQRSAIINIVSAGSPSSYPSINRNGYQSLSYEIYSGSRVTEIIFWDQAQGKAYKYNPYTNSALTIQTI